MACCELRELLLFSLPLLARFASPCSTAAQRRCRMLSNELCVLALLERGAWACCSSQPGALVPLELASCRVRASNPARALAEGSWSSQRRRKTLPTTHLREQHRVRVAKATRDSASGNTSAAHTCLRACQRTQLTSARRRGAVFNDEYAQSIYTRISADDRRRGKRLGAGGPPKWQAAPHAADDAPRRQAPGARRRVALGGPEGRPRGVGRAQGLGPRRLRERRGRALVRVGRALDPWFFARRLRTSKRCWLVQTF